MSVVGRVITWVPSVTVYISPWHLQCRRGAFECARVAFQSDTLTISEERVLSRNGRRYFSQDLGENNSYTDW